MQIQNLIRDVIVNREVGHAIYISGMPGKDTLLYSSHLCLALPCIASPSSLALLRSTSTSPALLYLFSPYLDIFPLPSSHRDG